MEYSFEAKNLRSVEKKITKLIGLMWIIRNANMFWSHYNCQKSYYRVVLEFQLLQISPMKEENVK